MTYLRVDLGFVAGGLKIQHEEVMIALWGEGGHGRDGSPEALASELSVEHWVGSALRSEDREWVGG